MVTKILDPVFWNAGSTFNVHFRNILAMTGTTSVLPRWAHSTANEDFNIEYGSGSANSARGGNGNPRRNIPALAKQK